MSQLLKLSPYRARYGRYSDGGYSISAKGVETVCQFKTGRVGATLFVML